MSRSYRIGIIGFGVAGGALALLLARAGHDVTIFERAAHVGPVGTGLLLQPSGQLVLRQLGLLDQIADGSEPIYELRAFLADGRTLVRLPYADVAPGCHAYGVHRGTLFGALHAAIKDEARVSLKLGCEIVGRRTSGDNTFAVDASEAEHGSFDFLIGADGARSRARLALDEDGGGREYDYAALWAVGRNTRIHNRLHQVVDGTRSLVGLLPIGADRCTLFWGVRRDGWDALRARGFAAWRSELTRLCPEAGETIDDIGGFDRVTFTPYRHAVMRRFYDDRLICIGDAAHAMSPHLGQGANLALVDAACFADALARETDHESAFRRYARERRSHVRVYGLLSRLLTPFFQSESRLLGISRDIALPLMCRVPPVRRRMAAAVTGMTPNLSGLIRGSRASDRAARLQEDRA